MRAVVVVATMILTGCAGEPLPRVLTGNEAKLSIRMSDPADTLGGSFLNVDARHLRSVPMRDIAIAPGDHEIEYWCVVATDGPTSKIKMHFDPLGRYTFICPLGDGNVAAVRQEP